MPTDKANSNSSLSEELEETSIDELVVAWGQELELSDEEGRQHVHKVLCDLLETLKVEGEPFFLPLDNDYTIMVEKKSEKALALTKIQTT